MATGWTFEEIGNHTLRDLNDLRRYWSAHPPLHMMVRGYFGINERSPPSPYMKNLTDSSKALTTHHNPTVEELRGILNSIPGF